MESHVVHLGKLLLELAAIGAVRVFEKVHLPLSVAVDHVECVRERQLPDIDARHFLQALVGQVPLSLQIEQMAVEKVVPDGVAVDDPISTDENLDDPLDAARPDAVDRISRKVLLELGGERRVLSRDARRMRRGRRRTRRRGRGRGLGAGGGRRPAGRGHRHGRQRRHRSGEPGGAGVEGREGDGSFSHSISLGRGSAPGTPLLTCFKHSMAREAPAPCVSSMPAGVFRLIFSV